MEVVNWVPANRVPEMVGAKGKEALTKVGEWVKVTGKEVLSTREVLEIGQVVRASTPEEVSFLLVEEAGRQGRDSTDVESEIDAWYESRVLPPQPSVEELLASVRGQVSDELLVQMERAARGINS